MSTPSVNSFRISQEAILSTVTQIQPLTRNYFQVKPLIFELNERVMAYFGRQDPAFYEELEVFFAEDRSALKILEFLQHDLKSLKIQFIIFSEKHAGDLTNQSGRNFIKDFKEFSGHLIARVKVEEDQLFPLLARKNSAAAN